MVYGNEREGYWADVMLRKSSGLLFQYGTPTATPRRTVIDAQRDLRDFFAVIKAPKKTHPWLDELRKNGIDPTGCSTMRVVTRSGLTRFAFLVDSEMAEISQQFVASMTEKAGGTADIDEWIKTAKGIVIRHVEASPGPSEKLLVPIYLHPDQMPLYATAYLVSLGIINIDAGEESESWTRSVH